MKKLKSVINYFSKGEIFLFTLSLFSITLSFFIFDKENYISLAASLIGATSLILNAKGNPIGQFLIVVFSILYGIISYSFSYYGEVITYLCMTTPMAIFALISWIRNPYGKSKAEVKVNSIKKADLAFMLFLALGITVAFYFILKKFNTANLLPSTLSVTTSFIAAYLTFRRSEFFAVAYACNDIVLIILWTLATIKDISYISVLICFIVFFINDIYGFINWNRMKKRQRA